ncbi:prepilin-type N-terminal cleavage/methylation domain-containing protein [Halanaerobium congolense]|uniref:prepilin-type N-terminal cleavage/methylation domain-containing protein n=1 Tax=Halanaerobium congolense TaxID=54121 RepID=UPI000922094C|nr:prepilin-type N-terminal cleavage/methylation domain-containing protein [Halanaerobium congolense]SHM24157.1 prepilin-type N-terminal cleavage/methylation domain-containing protein [Halanaerobium congolense]
MKKILIEDKGITLIEIIIVIAIVGIVSTAIYAAYFDSTRVWFFNKERIEVQQAQDIIQSWFANNIRQAKKITIAEDYLGVTDNDYLKIETTDNIIEFYIESVNQTFVVKYNGGTAREISNLKIDSFKISEENGSIKIITEIYNLKETQKYKFISIYYPRLLDV